MPSIAAIQMCSTPEVEENLQQAEELIRIAAASAQLLVLPENFALMGMSEQDKLRVKEKFGHGLIQDFLKNLAKSLKVWIVGGTIPIACDHPDKVRAASILINDQGEIVARYDKMHLFDVSVSATESYQESNRIEPGDKIVTTQTPLGKLGMAVCYDVRFPELFRYMFNQGSELFTLPSAFTVKTGTAHWEVLLRSRAIENFSYVVGAAQGGSHANGRKTYGHSVIVDPWGEVVAKIDGVQPGVITADIDLKKLHEIRQSIPVEKHQKIIIGKPTS